MSTIMVVAPHPDDETLGCGGTLARHVKEGGKVHWLIITGISVEAGFSADMVAQRDREIKSVAAHYGFEKIHRLGFPTTRLDDIPMGDVISEIADVFKAVKPETVYLPFRNDAHSDHKVVFDACWSCTKVFRYDFIRRVYAYEVLSETDYANPLSGLSFSPSLFVDITTYLEAKIAAMKMFQGEMGDFPFPRSEEAIRAQAAMRGAQAGVKAAEAFMVLKEIR